MLKEVAKDSGYINFSPFDEKLPLIAQVGPYGYLDIGIFNGPRFLYVVDPTRPKAKGSVLKHVACKMLGFPTKDIGWKKNTKFSRDELGEMVRELKIKFRPLDPFKSSAGFSSLM